MIVALTEQLEYLGKLTPVVLNQVEVVFFLFGLEDAVVALHSQVLGKLVVLRGLGRSHWALVTVQGLAFKHIPFSIYGSHV